MPGCWLKKGENEIIVLDLLGPKQTTIQGLEKPILDQLGGEPAMTHRRRGETLNLSTEQSLIAGAFNPGNGWQEVTFPETKMRYFCLEALSSQSGEPVAAIAELYLVGKDGKQLPRQEWKIVYADSEETSAGNCTADKVFDLQESMYWSTVFKGRNLPAYPHHIVIDLGDEYEVKGVRYLPRAESKTPGMIKDFKVYGKTAPFTIDKK